MTRAFRQMLRAVVPGAVLALAAACGDTHDARAAAGGESVVGRSTAAAPQRADAPTPAAVSDTAASTSPGPATATPAARVAPPTAPARVRAGTAGDARAASTTTAAGERSTRRVVVAGVDLTGIGYDRGSATAPVVIVDFSDFACPYCGRHARETLPAIEREYVATGKVFYKYVPFVAGFPNGEKAARAAECAADQGKFWAAHDRIYAAQSAWKRSLAPFQLFQAHAKALGLDVARFSSCYVEQRTDGRTRLATSKADELGIRATPTLVVNGRAVEGALPLAQLREVLDAVLQQQAGGR